MLTFPLMYRSIENTTMAIENRPTISHKLMLLAGACGMLAVAIFSIAPAAYASYNSSYNYGNSNYGNSHNDSYNHNNNNWNSGSYRMNDNNHDRDDHYPVQTYHYQPQTPIYNYYYPQTPVYNYSYPTYYQYPQSYPVSYPTTYYEPAPQTYYQPTYYQSAPTYYQSAPTYAYQTPSYTSYPYVNQSNASGLTISCSAEPSTAIINQPVTWTAEVSGGSAPYTYSWSGSGGLSGSQSSVTEYYDTVGQESAVVIVTSANGLSGTHACDNTLTVEGSGANYIPQSAPASPQAPVENNPNAAAAGLSAVSFGVIAVLIILILIGAIIYLMSQRRKVV